MTLLSIGTDAKTVKGEKHGVQTAIQYLSPHTIASKRTVCPFATVNCSRDCLGTTSGRMPMPNVQRAMKARTMLYWDNRKGYLDQLGEEISRHVAAAKKKGFTPAVRLNGTSDIQWESTGIMERFPDVQFYDYTKFPPGLRRNLPPNYHLTYSYTGEGNSAEYAKGWMERGFNTAVVFRGGLPKTFLGTPVIDGDASDLRFTDPKGCVVGLKAKGKARTDVNPFIVDVIDGVAVTGARVEDSNGIQYGKS